ncbi:hypothetical protein A7A76_07660 [Lysobacter enzymogenes]|uniref:hypothetical protein n=1 Tax=Lysobacter enzymogenes TaxID=69 RepID=UPI0019D1D7B4|nr:hypothetical protein [Lysobacter enzymogenes]MBN7138969.1 hypothetical protein [Lysobacter enzymogenes]
MSEPAPDVLALAARAGLAVGQTVNVLLTLPDAEPMRRRLTRVVVRRMHGKDWLYWYWHPTGSTPWGTADCGFGGNVINAEFLAELREIAGREARRHV